MKKIQQRRSETVRWIIYLCLGIAAVICIAAFRKGDWLPWVGFAGKTIWDWLELLGVPLSLAILGFVLQQQQRKQATALAKEEILQTYFDRISVLLIDKDIFAIASDDKENTSADRINFLNVACDVIRARTLSILRRFKGDPVRKSSVISFLSETGVISRGEIDFSGIHLGWVKLCSVNLQGINLADANLERADLSRANLVKANLSRTDLSGINLSGADLSKAIFNDVKLDGADLSGATLMRTTFSDASLIEANLQDVNVIISKDYTSFRKNYSFLIRFRGANLTKADLSGANLSKADFRNAKLSGANLSKVNLKEADLYRADLTKANLSDAILSGANLTEANLNDSDISKTALDDCVLCRTLLPVHIGLDRNRDCQKLGIDLETGYVQSR